MAIGFLHSTHQDFSNDLLDNVAKDVSGGYSDQTSYIYDAADNVDAVTIHLSGQQAVTTVTCYDALRRPVYTLQNADFLPTKFSTPTISTCTSSGSSSSADILTHIFYDPNSGEPSLITTGNDNFAQTGYTYDALGRETSVTSHDPSGAIPDQKWQYDYDMLGNVNEITDPANPGHVTWRCYNLDSQLTYQVQNYSGSTPPACASPSSPSAIATPAGIINPSAGQNADHDLDTFVLYDGLGRVTDSWDTLHRRTYITYDGIGRISTQIANDTGGSFLPNQPDVNFSQYMIYTIGSGASSNTETITDSVGRTTKIIFDALQRQQMVTANYTGAGFNPAYPDLNVTTAFQYDGRGHVVGQSDPSLNPSPTISGGILSGAQIKFVYDGLDHLIQVTDPANVTTTTTYDDLGDITSIQSPGVPLTQFQYDNFGRRIATLTQQVSTSTDYSHYFTSARSVIATDGLGIQTRYAYDAFGRLSAVTRHYTGGTVNVSSTPGPNDTDLQTTYSYDQLNNLTGVQLPADNPGGTSPNQFSRSYFYDGVNRVHQIQQTVTSGSNTWTLNYDQAGRQVQLSDAMNRITNITYDNLDQVLGDTATNTTFSYSYNGMDKQVTMTSGGVGTSLQYDAMDRLVTLSGGTANQNLLFGYDANGRRSGITVGQGATTRTISYNYCDTSCPAGVAADALQNATLSGAWSSNGQVSYTYFQGQQIKTVNLPNGVTETLGYDLDGRLTNIDYKAGATALYHVDYILDANGNRRIAHEYLQGATSTPCPSPTATFTPSATPTSTPSSMPTGTSVYAECTATPTPRPTGTATFTSSPTPTNTNTSSPTPAMTATPTASLTPSFTPSLTPSSSPTFTFTPSSTPETAPTFQPGTGTASPSPTATNTAQPTNTPTRTPSNTQIPTNTATPFPTNTPTVTPSKTNTLTNTPLPSNTSTPLPTNTPSYTPSNTATPTNTPSKTNTSTPTATYTPSKTNTPSTTPTARSTPTKSPTATFTSTNTPLPTCTLTPTATPNGGGGDGSSPLSGGCVTPTSTLTPTNTPTTTYTPTYTPTPTEFDTIGIFRISSGTFYLRNSNTSGNPDITAAFNPASTPYPIVGNWVGGSGSVDTIGVYDQSNGVFYLRNSNSAGSADEQFTFGNPGDIPISGRWTSDMTHDGVGTYRPSIGGEFFIKHNLTTGNADYTELLGIPGDLPITGDWNGDGTDSPGVYRASNNTFYLTNVVTNGTATANYSFSVTGGGSGFVPIAGDWTGQGHDGVGLYNSASGQFLLKNQLSSGAADSNFGYGVAKDMPVAGQWAVHAGNQFGAPPSILVQPTPAAPTFQPSLNGLMDFAGGNAQPAVYLPAQPALQSGPTSTLTPSPTATSATATSTIPTFGPLNRVITYNYDNVNRLTGAAYKDNNASTYNFGYSYDLNGNRTNVSETAPGLPTMAATYVYNAANQLSSATVNGATLGFNYNPNGDLTSETSNGNPLFTYGYDSADRLTSVLNAATGQTIQYGYDGFGNRASQTIGSLTTNYLVDPSGSIPQLLGEFPSASAPTFYIPGLGQDNGAMGYFGMDGVGSVRQITDGSGALSYAANFDPYGNLLQQNPGVNTNLGYTGAPTDSSGLVYLNARFYNPALGSFQTHDPLEGTLGNPESFNGYSYTQGNPVTLTDPSGKCIEPLSFIVCSALVVGGAAFIGQWLHQVSNNAKQGEGFSSVYAQNLNGGALASAFGEGALTGGGVAVGGLGVIAAPGAALAYGAAAGAYTLGRDYLDTVNASPWVKGAVDVGGVLTGMAFVREDVRTLSNPNISPADKFQALGDAVLNVGLGASLFSGIRYAFKGVGLARQLAEAGSTSERQAILQQVLSDMTGRDVTVRVTEKPGEFLRVPGQAVVRIGADAFGGICRGLRETLCTRECTSFRDSVAMPLLQRSLTGRKACCRGGIQGSEKLSAKS